MEKTKTLQLLLEQLTEKAAAAQLTLEEISMLAIEAQATANRLLQAALEFTESWQADRYLRIQAVRIIEWDDSLWHAAQSTGNDTHPIALEGCRVLHRLCRELTRNISSTDIGTLLLPQSFRVAERNNFAHRWATIRETLENRGGDEALLHLLDRPVEKFVAPALGYSLYDYRYLLQYLEGWEAWSAPTPIGTPANVDKLDLITQLIHIDYNTPRIFSCIVEALDGDREAVEAFIHPMGLAGPLPYAPENPGLLEELKSWIGENRVSDPLTMGMSVPELAVCARMLHGVGLILERNLETVARKVARGFATKGTHRIQYHSLLKKLHVRDQDVKHTIKGWLGDMGRWLERNMN